MEFSEPLGFEDSAAFIFSSRQVRQRQPLDSASAGMGRCGSSKHQQLPSGWHVISEPHCEQRVCMWEVWREGTGG